jgi:hypothetical protein
MTCAAARRRSAAASPVYRSSHKQRTNMFDCPLDLSCAPCNIGALRGGVTAPSAEPIWPRAADWRADRSRAFGRRGNAARVAPRRGWRGQHLRNAGGYRVRVSMKGLGSRNARDAVKMKKGFRVNSRWGARRGLTPRRARQEPTNLGRPLGEKSWPLKCKFLDGGNDRHRAVSAQTTFVKPRPRH